MRCKHEHDFKTCPECQPAPSPLTKAAVPGRVPHHECYALIEVFENGEESATFYSSRSKRDEATLKAIWFGGPDESHKEEAEHYLETMREKGILTFEGDPPLKWVTMIPESELLKQVRQARAEAFEEAANEMQLHGFKGHEAAFRAKAQQAREEGK